MILLNTLYVPLSLSLTPIIRQSEHVDWGSIGILAQQKNARTTAMEPTEKKRQK